MLIVTRERIAQKLEGIPALVDEYQQRDPLFVERTTKWLSDLEQSLLQIRHPLASQAATERATILSTHDGYHPPQFDAGRATRRKLSQGAAVLALQSMDEGLRAAIADIDSKLDAWREKLAQLLAIASRSAPILMPPGGGRQNWLKEVWSGLGAADEAKAMHAYLNAAMAPGDRLQLLGELLDNMLEGVQPPSPG